VSHLLWVSGQRPCPGSSVMPRRSGRNMKSWKKALLVVSGLVPLLGLFSRPPDTMLLIYTFFVVAFLFRGNLAAFLERLPGHASLHLFILFLLSGSLTETLAWIGNFLKGAQEPALFHPQLIPDLILGMGFYGGWAIAWLIAFRWFRFNLLEAFVVTGFQGIFFEQLGAVFVEMLSVFASNPLLSILLGAYVFAVHGSVTGLAFAPLIRRFDVPHRSRHWVRFPVVIALMVSLAFMGTWLMNTCALLFGGLPAKRSIVEHPFW